MLQELNGTLCETTVTGSSLQLTSNCIDYGQYNITPYLQWNGYPVYVCHDKTKKAIDVLKALQAEKMIKCDSVPKFIELVEKISNLL